MPENSSQLEDFKLACMADDLVMMTLELCGKKQDKCTRFPKAFYSTFVDKIVSTALKIQQNIILANEVKVVEIDRVRLQREAEASCVYLNHLVRISFEKGWISEKQRDRWQGLTTSVKWKIHNWIISDRKRLG